MYNLTGKSFSQLLEERDPSENYLGTPLEGLDAFERQLKRFDIKVSGAGCDLVEKFFADTESAVLFPEFVKRAIRQGMKTTVLNEIVAASTNVKATSYKGYTVTEVNDSPYSTTTNEGAELPQTTIREDNSYTSLLKYGRLISASYEVVRQQRIDVFGVILRAIGVKLANALLAVAVTTLKTGVTGIYQAAATLAYSDLANLYGQFSDFNMTVLLASPESCAEILALSELDDRVCTDDGKIQLPFGTTLIKVPSQSDDYIIGIDKEFALEMITGSDLVMETDKLIDCQLDRVTVTLNAGFKKIMADAVSALNMSVEP